MNAWRGVASVLSFGFLLMLPEEVERRFGTKRICVHYMRLARALGSLKVVEVAIVFVSMILAQLLCTDVRPWAGHWYACGSRQ